MNTRAPLRVPSPTATAEQTVPIEMAAAPNNLPAVAEPKRNGSAPAPTIAPVTQGFRPYPPSIARAIVAIKREVGAIEKSALHKQQNYMYQPWEEILNAISPLITDHGLIITQSEVGRSVSDAGDLVMVNYEFTITDENGDVWPDRPRRSALAMLRAKSGFVNEKAIVWCDANAEKAFYKQFFNIRTKDAEEGEAAKKPPVPSPSGKVAPHAIPTKGENVQTWAPKFISAIVNAESEAELTEWDKLNDFGLNIVNDKAPELYAAIVKAVENRRAELAPKALDAAPVKPKADGIPDAATMPEEFLKWADAQMVAVTDPHALDPLYNDMIEPQATGLFPPDKEELAAMLTKHERRLEP